MKNCQYFNLSSNHWASSGHREDYKWFAMTNYFDSKLFNINNYAKQCNDQINNNANSLESFWKILKAQLDNEPSLKNHSEICVINSEDIYQSDTQLEMNERVREYFSYHKYGIIRLNNGKMGIDFDAVKNKILVFPFVYLEPRSIEFLDFFAPKIIRECGAKSVCAIFACHIVDNQDGKYPEIDNFPHISQNSFAIEVSFDTVRSILNLMQNSKPAETFRRRAKPINLGGTSWKSVDETLSISFDEFSVNGSEYNGEFAIYSYDSTSKRLEFIIDNMFDGIRYTHQYKVLSLTSDQMELEGKKGIIILKKQ